MIPGFDPVVVHELLEMLALLAGAACYRHLRRSAGAGSILDGREFAVTAGCVFGAALGNKLVFWAEFPHLLPLYWDKPSVLFAGQSMVGGLLGGLAGVEIAKKISGITRSTGDAFVFPVLLGLIIGRMGCFLAGLADGTHGNPTGLPWGVDFGDGIPRHPTQLYEIAFAILMWGGLAFLRRGFSSEPGLLFKTLLVAYLVWRLAVDGIKPVPFSYFVGLSGIQVVCLLALAIYGPSFLLQYRRWRHGQDWHGRPMCLFREK